MRLLIELHHKKGLERRCRRSPSPTNQETSICMVQPPPLTSVRSRLYRPAEKVNGKTPCQPLPLKIKIRFHMVIWNFRRLFFQQDGAKQSTGISGGCLFKKMEPNSQLEFPEAVCLSGYSQTTHRESIDPLLTYIKPQQSDSSRNKLCTLMGSRISTMSFNSHSSLASLSFLRTSDRYAIVT